MSSADPPREAMLAALDILSDEPTTPPPAAPPTSPEEATPQPEQGGRRDSRGRYTRQAAPPPTPAPQEPEAAPVDWEAVARQERQERERLRGSYGHNLSQKDQEILRLKQEAQEAREAAQRVRDQTRRDYEEGIRNMPEGPEKWSAQRWLLDQEREEFKTERQSWEQQQQRANETQQQFQARLQDDASKAAHWAVMQAYVYDRAQAAGWERQEAEAFIEELKTPELGSLIARLPYDELRPILNQRGDRITQEIARRSEARLERNRQAAIREGHHAPVVPGQNQPGPRPSDRYVRGASGVRAGDRNLRDMAYALLEEE